MNMLVLMLAKAVQTLKREFTNSVHYICFISHQHNLLIAKKERIYKHCTYTPLKDTLCRLSNLDK